MLIKRMLTLDPAQRISAKEALEDPWMQKNSKTRPLNKKILDNLSAFSVFSHCQQHFNNFLAN